MSKVIKIVLYNLYTLDSHFYILWNTFGSRVWGLFGRFGVYWRGVVVFVGDSRKQFMWLLYCFFLVQKYHGCTFFIWVNFTNLGFNFINLVFTPLFYFRLEDRKFGFLLRNKTISLNICIDVREVFNVKVTFGKNRSLCQMRQQKTLTFFYFLFTSL